MAVEEPPVVERREVEEPRTFERGRRDRRG